jgi:putative sterol carrier protein
MVKWEEVKEEAEDWAKEYCQALNNSPEYEKAAKGWGIDFDGSILLKMTKSGEMEFDAGAFADLKDGKCLGITVIGPDDDLPRPPGLILEGPMLLWKQIAFKERDVIKSLMHGDLIVEGDMGMVMKYAQAAMMLADITEKTDRTWFTKLDLGE